jgi:succinate dehydrogenase/fumarate reductase cytochrome b subunit
MTTPASAAPRRAAREVESTPALRWLARAGFAANGVIHILIGVLVIVLATGGRGEGDQSGALKAVAEAPFGFLALWVLAIALAALGVWYVFDGILSADPRPGAEGAARKWGRRLAAWGKALVFLAFGVLSASVALGARPNSDSSAENASRTAFAVPGGAIVLLLVGVAIGVGGVAFVVIGIRQGFRKKMDMPPGPWGKAVAALGVAGFACKGVALVLVAVLLTVAVVTADPEAAGGLNNAFEGALHLPGGPFLVGAIGVGLIAYGLFCLIRARYARLRAGDS